MAETKEVKTEKTITVVVEWDGKEETREYECDSFLVVMVDKRTVSTTFIFDADPSKPVTCYF